MSDNKIIKGLSKTFKALADEKRLRVLKLLEHGELCVCDIVGALCEVQPKISFHLAVLRDAGLIKDRKHGRWICYRLDDSDIFRRFLILSAIERIPDEAVEEDRKRLREFMRKKGPGTMAIRPA